MTATSSTQPSTLPSILRTCMQLGASRTLARVACFALWCGAAIVGSPLAALAQEPRGVSAVDAVKNGVKTGARKIALDPTTYAPALITYDATVRDWNTSQVFFAHGYHERNERFTVSGLPSDWAISYAEGQRRIVNDALMTLGVSVAQNAAGYAVEGALAKRYPEHRRLLKTLGWIQRASLSSYMSYRLSVMHYRQTQYNATLARSLGYQ